MLELDFASATDAPSSYPLGITTFRTWNPDAGWPTQHGLVTTNYQQDNAYAYQTFLSTDSDAVFMYRNWASDRQEWREWRRMADGESFDEHVANTGIHHTHNNKIYLDQLNEDTDGNLIYKGERIGKKTTVDALYRDVALLNLQQEMSDRV
ncbi:hypothetical protein, partial [Geomicrobium sp. JCM 19037]|uniref:hypothetical protein n=1 Tax=Geomicrobium sp. JCM 19037 TaxID=1460634 RepID=UPI0005A75036